MLTAALIMLIAGAAITAGANLYGNIKAREEEKKQSEYDLKQHETDTQATLDTLDADLAQQKEADFRQATAIERGASAEFTSRMQQTYLGQIQAEHEYVDQLAEGESISGGVRAAAGTSGAGKDAILERVVNETIGQKNDFVRENIDRTRDAATTQGLAMVEEAKTQANVVRSRYDSGSAYMEFFNTKRQGIVDSTTLKTNYLQDIYDDAHTYDGWDLTDDIFGVISPFASAAVSYGSSGLMGGGAKAKKTPSPTGVNNYTSSYGYTNSNAAGWRSK